jgi:hypothetical protein
MQKIIMLKKHADAIHGGLTQTSKMPCKSYSLPTEACQTGFKMAQIPGTVCAVCYADRGFYSMYAKTIKPAQFARLDSLTDEMWADAIANSIGNDSFFRWHDSGDLQSLSHLEQIVRVCELTPNTRHWLPTREFGIVKEFISKHGINSIPGNLVVRLSAMRIDEPVKIPKSLQGIRGITVSNVHKSAPLGQACAAPEQNGECRNCRECWNPDTVISYAVH